MNLVLRRPLTLVWPAVALLAVVLSTAAFGAEADKSAEIEKAGGKPLEYKQVTGAPLRLFVFSPEGAKASDSRPAILFFFGGGWDHGDPSQFIRQANYLTTRGMVVVLPEYRTKKSHGTTPLECAADGQSAVRWVRAHAKELGVNPERIAAGGGSAGGHVAVSTALLAEIEKSSADQAVSCVPNALVLYNPVVDTTASGYGARKLGDRAKDGSPVHHIRAGLPPTIIFHGYADKTVDFENVQRFTVEMKKAGNDCRLMGYPGQGHGFYIRGEPYYFTTVLRETDKFLAGLGWIGGEPTLPEIAPAPKAQP